MSLKIIQKNIRTITTNAAKLNVLIHTTAVLIAEHASEHGDCSPALDLVNAMPASMRRTMLVLWFETYSPIRFQLSEGRAVKVGMLKRDAKKYTPFNIEGGREHPFYELAERNPESKKLDFAALVALVASLSKRIDKKVDNGEVEEADAESARAISSALAGLKFERVKAVESRANDDAPKANLPEGFTGPVAVAA